MTKKQSDLPGVTGPGVSPMRIPAIETAAETYKGFRDRRLEVQLEERKAKQKLLDLMHAHEEQIGKNEGKMVYACVDIDEDVIIEPEGEKLKVRKRGTGDDNESEE